MLNEVYYGEVIFFDSKKGYGFISWDKDGVKQTDMFLHYSGISCEGFKTVFKGQKVSFQLGVNNFGKPKAINVIVLRN